MRNDHHSSGVAPSVAQVMGWLSPRQLVDLRSAVDDRLGELAPAQWCIREATITSLDDRWRATSTVAVGGTDDDDAGAQAPGRGTADAPVGAVEMATLVALARAEPVGVGLWWARMAGGIHADVLLDPTSTLSGSGPADRRRRLERLLASTADGLLRLRTPERGFLALRTPRRCAALEVVADDAVWHCLSEWARMATRTNNGSDRARGPAVEPTGIDTDSLEQVIGDRILFADHS